MFSSRVQVSGIAKAAPRISNKGGERIVTLAVAFNETGGVINVVAKDALSDSLLTWLRGYLATGSRLRVSCPSLSRRASLSKFVRWRRLKGV
jgi:hypothetical protein